MKRIQNRGEIELKIEYIRATEVNFNDSVPFV